MARFSRIEVTQGMRKTGIVPVFFHPDIEICKKVLLANLDPDQPFTS